MAKRKKADYANIGLTIMSIIAIGIIAALVIPKLLNQAEVKYATVGKPAPDFSLLSLEGKKISLSQLKGKPVILNFWATWCPPCKLEMPAVAKVYAKSGEKGFAVLTVNQQEDKQTIEKFIKENGYTLPIVLDTAGEVADLYRVTGIPTTVFINSQGIVTDIHTGTMPLEELFFSKVKY